MGYGPGRGYGFGRGRGRGRGWGYVSPLYPTVPYDAADATREDAEALKEQAKFLGETLENINRRIAELEKGKKQ
jgi:hypothetical protein